ncbi:MAG: helix-turn-helix transcriptional regulator [Spirochaetia bacterium]|nr:helix-turn-helix transcriptional regulator [Spirochaetia bacterium]
MDHKQPKTNIPWPIPAEIHIVGREARDATYHRNLKVITPPRRHLFQATLSGGGRVALGKHIHKVGKNQALFLPAPSRYIYEAVGNWEFVHLSVKTGWAHEVADRIHEQYGPVLDIPEGSRALRTALEAVDRYRANDFLSPFESASMACRFLFALLDDLEGPPVGKRPRFIETAIAHIRRNLDKPIVIGDIAAKSGMSREHFTREFIRNVGVSPAAYVWNVRISEGANLLTNSSTSVREIARKTGFSDTLTFTRAFKRRFSTSPENWRNSGPV